jgi:hypothetical protein
LLLSELLDAGVKVEGTHSFGFAAGGTKPDLQSR